VRGDDPKGFAVVELLEENFGERTTQFWIRTSTEFVNQEQGFLVAFLEEIIHILEPVTVRAQMIFNRLVVADVGKDSVKQKGFATLVHRINIPDCSINCSKPTDLSEMVFPPALEEITMMRLSCESSKSADA
jgi:hypothetical protein